MEGEENLIEKSVTERENPSVRWKVKEKATRTYFTHFRRKIDSESAAVATPAIKRVNINS